VYQQMKEAIWGAGLVRGLTGEQKNTGAGAGEGSGSTQQKQCDPKAQHASVGGC